MSFILNKIFKLKKLIYTMAKETFNPEEKKEIKEEVKKAIHQKLLENASTFRSEYQKQVSTAVITAFGLVIALTWKDVVTALMPKITTPNFLTEYPLLSQIYVAGIVTLLAIIGILIISRWNKTEKTN